MASRLIIFADVHLGFAPLAPGATDVLHTHRLLREAVEKALALRPDRVVLLGDIVNSGEAEEHELARRLLAPLASRLEAVPGNHELLRGNLDDWQRAWGAAPYRHAAMGDLPAALLNSGIEGLPLSQWGGRLDAAQLTWLDGFLQARRSSPVLAFCHHPLAGTVRRSDQPMMGLDNSPELSRRLVEHPRAAVLFSGHAHYQHVVHLPRLICVSCPPLCFWPHAFLVVEIDGLSLHYKTVRLIERPENSPDPHAGDAEYRQRAEGQKIDQLGTLLLD
jgi:3',5'-cyclic-AMP phosphodiesterase